MNVKKVFFPVLLLTLLVLASAAIAAEDPDNSSDQPKHYGTDLASGLSGAMESSSGELDAASLENAAAPDSPENGDKEEYDPAEDGLNALMGTSDSGETGKIPGGK